MLSAPMLLGTLAAAFAIALGLTPLARAIALRYQVVDVPDDRKIHAHPTPLLGGVAVFIAVAGASGLASLFSGLLPAAGPGVLFGGLLFLCIGLVDDVHNVGAAKLLLEFVVAWLVVQITGLSFHLPSPIAATTLTVFWIVGVANALNCLDCADGVATGIGLVAGGAILAIAILTRQPLVMLLAAAIVGAALGFLPYNVHPAKIFLGDAGSLTFGYLVAIIAVMVSPGVLSVPALASKAVILAIPVYDIIRVHILRFVRGKRRFRELLTSTGKDHLPHRLMARGISRPFVAVVLVVASMATGAAGVALVRVDSAPWAIAIGLTVVATLVILEREWWPVSRRSETLAAAAGWDRSEGG